MKPAFYCCLKRRKELGAKKENDILEKTLAIAESGYPEAYQFLMDAYEVCPESYGPQTLYFLSCLAGGTDKKTDALMWLKKAISDCPAIH